MRKRNNDFSSLKENKLLSAVCLLLFAVAILSPIMMPADEPMTEEASLVSCVDGDTARFMISGKEESVRFLAVDTPETVKPGTPVQPYGKEASSYTCKRLSEASNIRLTYERGNERDKYGRMLAWVFVDNDLLQQKLVEQGLAKVAYVYGDYMYTDILKNAEEDAKSNAMGMWSR